MRRVVLLAATWAVGTVVATVLAWQAVSLVSDQVTEDRPAALSQAQVDDAVATTDTTTPAATSTTGPGSTSVPPATDPSATVPPGTPPVTAPPPTTGPPATNPPTTSPPTTAPALGSRTFSSVGGRVTVRCTSATTIARVLASPEPGFEMKINDDGPDEVDVEFEDDDHKYRLRTTCSSGQPVGGWD